MSDAVPTRAAVLLSTDVDPSPSPSPAAGPVRLLQAGGARRLRVSRRPQSAAHPEYPRSTDGWCWHCCHPFATQPLPLPVAYDDRRDVFHVMGTFCSFACMKAYNCESTSYMKHVSANVITLFHKRCTGKLTGVRPAPPRVALRVFGGTMTIDEFRAASREAVEYRVLPPRMIMHEQAVQESRAAQREQPRRHAVADLGEHVSFGDVSTRNETLRLKRPKPPRSTQNLLERTMGISTSLG